MSSLRRSFGASSLLLIAVSCGSSSSSDGDAAGGGPSGAGKDGFQITIDLPPDVEARLRQLIDELSSVICQRSRNCCASYGLQALGDCRELAGGPFVLRASSVIFDGAENFDFAIDEALATACVAAAQSVVSECIFAKESLFYAWTDPCLAVLRVTKKGETPEVCRTDLECTARLGAGHVCSSNACVPLVEVATGSSCATPSSPTSIPQCAASDFCNFHSVCEKRTALGGVCTGQDTCEKPYACARRVIDADTEGMFCVEPAAAGERCDSNEECAEGQCACSPDVGCAAEICLHIPHFGDACRTDDDCSPLTMTCVDSRCSPRQLTLCQ